MSRDKRTQNRGTLRKPRQHQRKNPPPIAACLRPSTTICSHGNGLQDGDGGDEREGGVQALVYGDEVEEGAPVRGVQDRRALARRAGGQGRRPRGGVRGARRRPAQRRLPLRRLRLRFRLRRQLPEEQDLLHRLVTDRIEDKSQDSVRDVEARPEAGAGRGPLRGAGHGPLRDGLRRHQRPRAMSCSATPRRARTAFSASRLFGVPKSGEFYMSACLSPLYNRTECSSASASSPSLDAIC